MKIARNALKALSIAAESAVKTHTRNRASKLKGGRRSDGSTRELVSRIIRLLNQLQPNLTKTKQNAILEKILELAGAACSVKTIETVRRLVEQRSAETTTP